MTSAERERIARAVLERARSDETEVLVSAEDSGLTRFTHNAIHQNVAAANVTVGVRTITGQRVGAASTNALDAASLDAVVRRAEQIAEFAPRDPDFPPLPGGGETSAPPGAFDAATSATPPARRAELARALFDIAERDGLWSAGYVTTSSSGITVANSRGVLASFDGTDGGVNVKMNGPDSTGYAEQYSHVAGTLDGAALGETAARKALDSAAPQTVEAGPWTVILEPAAFGELLAFLFEHFSAQSYDEGSSFLTEGLERTYCGENVTLLDDYAEPLNPGMPFDFEGTPTKRMALIENGVAKNVVTDSYWAAKLQRENTGHALPGPNAWGPQPLHPVMRGGTKSIAELVAETERGLLVSRFWYIRTVDQRQTIVTGMTRDGTFLIEKGKVKGGVRNMRFNQSILAALRRCEFSRELRRTGGYSYSLVAPAAKIERFGFSSGTEF